MKKFILSAFADEAGSAVSEQIKALQENGMTHLEVRGVNGKNIVDLTLEEAKELKKELDDGGISVWAIGSPLGKISVGDEFAPHLDKMKHTLELADILGTTHIRMFSFFCPKGEADLCRELVLTGWGNSATRPRAAASSSATRTKRAFTATPPPGAWTSTKTSRN